MEITEREAKLLKTLKTHKKPISCDKLADLCGLSADTVRRELGFLSTSLKSDTGCRITGQRGHGYQLIVVEPQLAETFFNRLAQQYQWDEQSDVRILTALLLCRILASPKSLTWPGLIEEFQISEDWLPEIILIAKAQLATFELALQPEDEGENVRFTVCGSELQKRILPDLAGAAARQQAGSGTEPDPVLPGDFHAGAANGFRLMANHSRMSENSALADVIVFRLPGFNRRADSLSLPAGSNAAADAD